MVGNLTTFYELPWQDKCLTAKAAFLLVVVALVVGAFGLKRGRQVGRRLPGFRQPPVPLQDAIDRARSAVGRASRGLGVGTCLTRSLTLQIVLRRWGVDTDLRIGVRRQRGDLRAHAWLEFLGEPLEDAGGVAAYRAFPGTC